jgi:hypothetical protein
LLAVLLAVNQMAVVQAVVQAVIDALYLENHQAVVVALKALCRYL